MQIGVVYPQTELRGDPTAVKRFATAAEDLGFDHLLAYDHVLGAVHADRARRLTGPYTEHDPFHDPLVMFAYLAGITERIQFATGVLVLPQRPTALVAHTVKGKGVSFAEDTYVWHSNSVNDEIYAKALAELGMP